MEFDENFLQEVGLAAMPEAQKQSFLDYVQEELEVRIGMKVAEGMDIAKLREFEAIEDDEKAVEWLKVNRPDYKEIVNDTIAEMKAEIAANRERILN